VGTDKKCVQNYGRENSWTMPTLRGQHYGGSSEKKGCKDGRQMELVMDHVKWHALVLSGVESLGSTIIASF
jgi:hypothetical protein